LLAGEIRSAFAMTEPDVASSDATNIETGVRRNANEYVINGRKWWTSGALDPRCKIMIVMGQSDPHVAEIIGRSPVRRRGPRPFSVGPVARRLCGELGGRCGRRRVVRRSP
jgi:alkylation response protein AidB-like acyl-CoA dehydrogenase